MQVYATGPFIALALAISAISAPGRLAAQDAAPPHDEQAAARAAIERAEAGWWAESTKTRDARLEWWREARFGCFMHWGVYAVLAGEWDGRPVGGYSEHIQRQRKLDQATYRRLAVEKFNPVDFDADEWAALLKQAGMRYLIITAKHHDGFAMFDSAVSQYNVVDATPFGRDPMRELRDACRRQGIRFGFYYSQAFDWGEADGAGNDWEYKNPGGDDLLGGRDWWETRPADFPRIRDNYTNTKAIPQIKELLGKYEPDILWFDTPHKLPFSENLRILEEIRKVAPDVVVNGRLARGHGRNFGDYLNTGDRAEEFSQVGDDWEGIPTTNESYGHHRHDHSHKPPGHFIRSVAKAVSRNGNLLLNVGPMANGEIDPKDVAILEGIGAWMQTNGESIHGCGLTPLAMQAWGTSTRRDNTLYLHVFDWPPDGRLRVGGLESDPASAELLTPAGPQPLRVSRPSARDLAIELPADAPFEDNSVIRLSFDETILTEPIRLLSAAGHVNRLLAFDAERSRSLGVGDGKRDRYYVSGMRRPEHRLTWRVRLNEPATYDVVIRYAGGDRGAEGRYVVSVDTHELAHPVTQPAPGEAVRTEPVGTLTVPAGEHTITLRPEEFRGRGELFLPLELQLRPRAAR